MPRRSLADAFAASDLPALAAAPDALRLEAMRTHLKAVRPFSGNEALKVLRRAFPDAPLAERVHAVQALSFGLD